MSSSYPPQPPLENANGPDTNFQPSNPQIMSSSYPPQPPLENANGPDTNFQPSNPQIMSSSYPPQPPLENANGPDTNFQPSNPQNPISDGDVEVGMEDEFDEWEDSDEEYDVNFTGSPVSYLIYNSQQGVKGVYNISMEVTRGYLFHIIFCCLYTAYFLRSMYHEFGDEGSIRLFVCTIIGVIIASRHLWLYGLKLLYRYLLGPDGMSPKMERIFNLLRFITRWVLYAGLAVYAVYILVDELSDDIESSRCVLGFMVMVFLCLIFSSRPHMINWHTIIWSVGLQFLLSVFTLRYEFGQRAIEYTQDRINEFFDNAENAYITSFGANYQSMGVTFSALPVAFMASAALAVLYYIGAMQFFVMVLGKVFKFILDTDYVESLSVAGGIFIDGPLAIIALRPYLSSQSKSQLFTIILSTISSVGGATVAIFGGLQIPLQYILASMLISAPATFTVGKLLLPERKRKGQKDDHSDAQMQDDVQYANILDAFQLGALQALPLVANVIAIVFAFLCGIDWISHTLEWFGDRMGKEGFTLDYVFSYVMYPIALAMGIDNSECLEAGRIIGIKLFSSGIIAFIELQKLVANRKLYDEYIESTFDPIVTHVDDGILLGDLTFLDGGIITKRTEVILTFGLCGLSSFLSVSITFASLYAFLPKRRSWLAKVAPVAALGGNLANFMTGCFAGIFYDG